MTGRTETGAGRGDRVVGMRPALALAVLAVVAALAVPILAPVPHARAYVWVADAVLVAAGLVAPVRLRLPLLVATLLVIPAVVHATGAAPAATALADGIGDAVCVAVALALSLAWGGGRPIRSHSVAGLLRRTAAVALVGPMAGALVAATALTLLGEARFGPALWSRWTAGVGGALIVLPILVFPPVIRFDRPNALREFLEASAVLAGTLVLVVFAVPNLRFPFVAALVPMAVASVRLRPVQIAGLCSAVATAFALGGVGGAYHGLATASAAFDGGLQVAGGIAAYVPLCVAVLAEHIRRDKRALAVNAELLRRAFEGSAVAAGMVGRDGTFLRVNAACTTLFGRPEAAILGNRLDAFCRAGDLDADWPTSLFRSTADEIPYRDLRIVTPDGVDVWARVHVSAIRRHAGAHPLHLLVQIENIDAQRRAVDELVRVQTLWNFALEGAGQGVWEEDYLTGRDHYSPTWTSLLGFTKEDMAGRRYWPDMVHPDDRAEVVRRVHEHEAGLTTSFEATCRMRHADGRWIWILDRGRIIERDADGRPVRMVGTHTDITRQKENEEKLAILNERMRLATEAGGVGLWSYDVATGEVFWDERMHELYGIDTGGRSSHDVWAACLHPDDRDATLAVFFAAVERGTPYNTVFRIVRGDGEVRYIRTLAKMTTRADGGALMVGCNWDVTEVRLTADALAEEKERLRVTLHSIGDAVICTDTAGNVTFMNLAAETLTGHIEPMVRGAPLAQVYRPVHEDTGEDLPSSAAEALGTGVPVEMGHPAKLVRPDGASRAIRDSAAPVRAANGEIIGVVLVFQDVTNARALQRDLAYAASHDALTGLKNRTAFEGAVQTALAEARAGGPGHAVLFVDLDRFKILNDTAGHAAGDTLLREIAGVVRAAVRPTDVVARLGGDEFAVLLRDCRIEDAEAHGARIIAAVRSLRFSWNDRIYNFGASIGVTALDARCLGVAEALAQADVACYASKAGGRDRVSVYRPDASEAHRHLSDLHIVAGIRDGIESGLFRLYAQEIRDLSAPLARAPRIEILTRMIGPDGALVPPDVFIPAAERFDLMGALDRWVLSTTLRDHGARIMAVEGLTVAVNLSANSLSDPSLWGFLSAELAATGFDPARLVLEITETAVINNFAAAERFIAAARAAGCRVSLDDFGSGVSSFTYLKRFPVDAIKIDGTFVRNMKDSRYDRTIVRMIHEVGVELGVETIAEFVEDVETVDLLRRIGVVWGQGYLFHRPRPLDEVLSAFGAAVAAPKAVARRA